MAAHTLGQSPTTELCDLASDRLPYLLVLWPICPDSSHRPFLSQALQAPSSVSVLMFVFICPRPSALLTGHPLREVPLATLAQEPPSHTCVLLLGLVTLCSAGVGGSVGSFPNNGRSHRVGTVPFFARMYPDSEIGTQDVVAALHKVSLNKRLGGGLSEFCS